MRMRSPLLVDSRKCSHSAMPMELARAPPLPPLADGDPACLKQSLQGAMLPASLHILTFGDQFD